MNKILKFFKESKDELAKVVWPSKKKTIEMSIAVIIVVIFVGLYLGALDYILTEALTLLLKD
jgi:preprotein translocase subunit SecE